MAKKRSPRRAAKKAPAKTRSAARSRSKKSEAPTADDYLAQLRALKDTTNEDFAMLVRYDVMTEVDGPGSQIHAVSVAPTPNPTPEGVVYLTPEILPEGDPSNPEFFTNPDA